MTQPFTFWCGDCGVGPLLLSPYSTNPQNMRSTLLKRSNTLKFTKHTPIPQLSDWLAFALPSGSNSLDCLPCRDDELTTVSKERLPL
jgi:hypothetical protein